MVKAPERIIESLRKTMERRTADVAARITGIPRRTLFRIVAGESVRRATLERLIEWSGTSGTVATGKTIPSRQTPA